jgi:hypothetical protein
VALIARQGDGEVARSYRGWQSGQSCESRKFDRAVFIAVIVWVSMSILDRKLNSPSTTHGDEAALFQNEFVL